MPLYIKSDVKSLRSKWSNVTQDCLDFGGNTSTNAVQTKDKAPTARVVCGHECDFGCITSQIAAVLESKVEEGCLRRFLRQSLHNGSVRQRLVNILDHLLCIRQQHHRVVGIKHIVIDAGIAHAAHAALDEEHSLGLAHIEHRHPVDG